MKKPKPTIVIDSRERKPWNFDSDNDFAGVIVQKLDVGDYSIVGLENYICIERKLSADELYVNSFCKKNRERLYREMQRFQGVKHRFMIIEEELADVMDSNSYFVNTSGRNKRSPKMPPAVVMKELLGFILDYNIHVIFAGNRGQVLAKKLLLRAYKDFDAKAIPNKKTAD